MGSQGGRMRHKAWFDLLLSAWMIFVLALYVANVILPKIQGKI